MNIIKVFIDRWKRWNWA